jgi:hypothetical protein
VPKPQLESCCIERALGELRGGFTAIEPSPSKAQDGRQDTTSLGVKAKEKSKHKMPKAQDNDQTAEQNDQRL